MARVLHAFCSVLALEVTMNGIRESISKCLHPIDQEVTFGCLTSYLLQSLAYLIIGSKR